MTWRRRRSRRLTWTVAAAAVLVIGVLVALTSNAAMQSPTPPQADAAALTMTPVKPIPLSATVSLSGHDWGTRIEMNCTYGAEPPDTDHDDAGDTLAIVAVGCDCSHTQLATWVALTGVPRPRAAAPRSRLTKSLLYKSFLPMWGDAVLRRNL